MIQLSVTIEAEAEKDWPWQIRNRIQAQRRFDVIAIFASSGAILFSK